MVKETFEATVPPDVIVIFMTIMLTLIGDISLVCLQIRDLPEKNNGN